MARRAQKSVGALADSIMAKVGQEQLVKSAALSHTSGVSVKSAVAQLLVKTAERVREEAANTEISYDDLATFRKKYDI